MPQDAYGTVYQRTQVIGLENGASSILTAPTDQCLRLVSVGFYASTYNTADVYLGLILLPPNAQPPNETAIALTTAADQSKTGFYAVAAGQAQVAAAGPAVGNTLYPLNKWFSSGGGPILIPPAWSLAVWFSNADPSSNVYEMYAVGVPCAKS